MKITKMKIEDLYSPERNVRIHTEKQIDEFVRSIKMFGQIRPVVIDENNMILAGNGLIMAMKKAGKDQVDVYRIEGLTENQKKKLMIADNKIFSLGIENLDTLNAFLEELGNDLDIPGFDEEILKSMVAEAESVTQKLSQYGTLDDKEIENMRNNSAKKEALIESASQTNESSDSYEQEDEEETADIKRYVICPKCGEQIWL
jgi:ParB-like chromosome segregation protein Spo0J